ncbi:MAG: N-acetyltransferase [Planctomycetes bacterium]|nr:N-acetyltransferase [Planctomycetota bacterium]
MKIRNAKISDVKGICSLISSHAEFERMLFRSLADLYESIQQFKVADSADGGPVGCCALQVVWEGLGEIKSLAVDGVSGGKGIGRELVNGCIDEAKVLGLKTVFTLTLEPEFFEKCGFKQISKDSLPMKVWSDCAKCSKQDHCDEIAMAFEISG